jgi:hypothetical protein
VPADHPNHLAICQAEDTRLHKHVSQLSTHRMQQQLQATIAGVSRTLAICCWAHQEASTHTSAGAEGWHSQPTHL